VTSITERRTEYLYWVGSGLLGNDDILHPRTAVVSDIADPAKWPAWMDIVTLRQAANGQERAYTKPWGWDRNVMDTTTFQVTYYPPLWHDAIAKFSEE